MKMKKVILLFISSLLLFSCSNKTDKMKNIYNGTETNYNDTETIYNDKIVKFRFKPVEDINPTDESYWYVYGTYIIDDVKYDGWSLIKINCPYFDIIDAQKILYKYKKSDNFFIKNFIQIPEVSYESYINNNK